MHDAAGRTTSFAARPPHRVLGIVLAGYVLSFFHRTAPAAIAGELSERSTSTQRCSARSPRPISTSTRCCRSRSACWPTRLGPRRLLAGGSLVAGIGSLAFALAPELGGRRSRTARSSASACLSRSSRSSRSARSGSRPRRFATLNGITMFAGNLGAVVAGAPLAWVVTQASWRTVFVALAALSFALAAAHLVARARPPRDARLRARRRVAGRLARSSTGARARLGARQPRHLARVLRQRRRRRQLPRFRGPLGGALARARVRHAARRRRAAHEPAAAGRRVRRGRDRRRCPTGWATAAA